MTRNRIEGKSQKKIGVNKDGVTWGPMAELGTDMRDPTDEEWERHVDAHYKSFNAWMAETIRLRLAKTSRDSGLESRSR